MSDIDRAIMTPVEGALSVLPGAAYPAGRAAYGAALGAGLTFGLKPDFMFDKDGQPRKWIVFDPQDPNATIFPWWAGIAVPSILLSVFI